MKKWVYNSKQVFFRIFRSISFFQVGNQITHGQVSADHWSTVSQRGFAKTWPTTLILGTIEPNQNRVCWRFKLTGVEWGRPFQNGCSPFSYWHYYIPAIYTPENASNSQEFCNVSYLSIYNHQRWKLHRLTFNKKYYSLT